MEPGHIKRAATLLGGQPVGGKPRRKPKRSGAWLPEGERRWIRVGGQGQSPGRALAGAKSLLGVLRQQASEAGLTVHVELA